MSATQESSPTLFNPSNGIGRPCEYTEQDATTIIELISAGRSFTKACKTVGIPNDTVWRWRRDHPSFARALARAREESADAIVDEATEIVDDPASGATHEAVSWTKVRVDYRKWLASKYKPATYGDKIELGGEVAITTVVLRKFGPTIEGECTPDQQQIPTLPE